MIGIIGAMDEEVLALLEILQNKEKVTIYGRDFYKGTIEEIASS